MSDVFSVIDVVQKKTTYKYILQEDLCHEKKMKCNCKQKCQGKQK